MVAPLTKKCIDNSDKDTFSFDFFCDRCGKKWTSPPIAFADAGFSSIENADAQSMIWGDEHRAGFDRANLEAVFHFNYCEKCGMWVCDDCFEACENGQSYCADCMAKSADP